MNSVSPCEEKKKVITPGKGMRQTCHCYACEDHLSTRSRKGDFKTTVSFMLVLCLFYVVSYFLWILVNITFWWVNTMLTVSLILSFSKYKARFFFLPKESILQKQGNPCIRHLTKSLKVWEAFSSLFWTKVQFEKNMSNSNDLDQR